MAAVYNYPPPNCFYLVLFTTISLLIFGADGCVQVTRRPSAIMLMSDPKPGPPMMQQQHIHPLDDQVRPDLPFMPLYLPTNPPAFPPFVPLLDPNQQQQSYQQQQNQYQALGISGTNNIILQGAQASVPIDLDLPPGIYKISNAKVASANVKSVNPVAPYYVDRGSAEPVTPQPIYQPIQQQFGVQEGYYGQVDNFNNNNQGVELYEAHRISTVPTFDASNMLEPGQVYHGHYAATRKILSVVTRLPNRNRHYTKPPIPWTNADGFSKFKKAGSDHISKNFRYQHDDHSSTSETTTPSVTMMAGSDGVKTSTSASTSTFDVPMQGAESVTPFYVERPPANSCGLTRYTAAGPVSPPPKPMSSAVGELLTARMNDFPWQAWISLQHQEKTLFGSAAVINDNWLISSASFIRLANDMTDSIVPLFGLYDAEHVAFSRTDGVFSVPVAGVEFHPTLDFALIRLVTPLNTSSLDSWWRVQPVCLPAACGAVSKDDVCQTPGQTAWVAGWHYNLEDGGLLRKAKAAVTTNSRCATGLGKEWVTDDKICTEGADVCLFGYSGQLVARFPTGNSPKFALCGFATAQDCRKERPDNLGVFSRVCSALDWIHAKTGTTTPKLDDEDGFDSALPVTKPEQTTTPQLEYEDETEQPSLDDHLQDGYEEEEQPADDVDPTEDVDVLHSEDEAGE